MHAYIFLRLPANESEQMAVALLTKKDLAERIGCCERTVRNLLARDDGPAVTRVGGLVRVQEFRLRGIPRSVPESVVGSPAVAGACRTAYRPQLRRISPVSHTAEADTAAIATYRRNTIYNSAASQKLRADAARQPNDVDRLRVRHLDEKASLGEQHRADSLALATKQQVRRGELMRVRNGALPTDLAIGVDRKERVAMEAHHRALDAKLAAKQIRRNGRGHRPASRPVTTPDAPDRDAAMARLVYLAHDLLPCTHGKSPRPTLSATSARCGTPQAIGRRRSGSPTASYIDELLRVAIQLRQGIAAAAAALHHGDVAAAQRDHGRRRRVDGGLARDGRRPLMASSTTVLLILPTRSIKEAAP